MNFLTNSNNWWVQDGLLVQCANQIVDKCNKEFNLVFPRAEDPEGFNVFGFIDNSMQRICRQGGND